MHLYQNNTKKKLVKKVDSQNNQEKAASTIPLLFSLFSDPGLIRKAKTTIRKIWKKKLKLMGFVAN